jgi:hypothetical protein
MGMRQQQGRRADASHVHLMAEITQTRACIEYELAVTACDRHTRRISAIPHMARGRAGYAAANTPEGDGEGHHAPVRRDPPVLP